MKRLRIVLAIVAIVLAMLACGKPAEEWQLRGWTVTPSSLANTSTPIVPTQTPFVVVVSATPLPTLSPTKTVGKCVSADVAVNLRPSASDNNYPIMSLQNGVQVTDLGGRDGIWWFVQVGDKQGWISSFYLGDCK